MREHWNDVVSLFSVLAWILKGLGKIRLKVYFTVSTKNLSFSVASAATSYLKAMQHRTYSNVDLRLGKILTKYQANLEHSRGRRGPLWSKAPKQMKALSLYVFTDAAWQGCNAVAPVEMMIEKQKQLLLPKEQVGIQFIRFGNDPIGIERLEYLDSGLRKKYGKR